MDDRSQQPEQGLGLEQLKQHGLQQLKERGFAWIRGGFVNPVQARETARALVDARRAVDGLSALGLVGDFVLPPPGRERSRNFQTLHFDFGIPLVPEVEHDVGRYTALHIPKDSWPVSAVLRLVPLAPLLSQRSWPSREDLLARWIAYGQTHGAWDDHHGYVEGSLARVIEGAVGMPVLPSVKDERGFLCGMEFECLASELRFFECHSLSIDDVVLEVPLGPGELLVFDNLAVAHGRRGSRRPGELHQWVFGERNLGPAQQREVRERLLASFGIKACVGPVPSTP